MLRCCLRDVRPHPGAGVDDGVGNRNEGSHFVCCRRFGRVDPEWMRGTRLTCGTLSSSALSGSGNVDESGNFSVSVRAVDRFTCHNPLTRLIVLWYQVLSEAVKRSHGLRFEYGDEVVQSALREPTFVWRCCMPYGHGFPLLICVLATCVQQRAGVCAELRRCVSGLPTLCLCCQW